MLLICLWYAFDMHWDAHSQNFMPAPASVQVWNQLCQSDPIWIFNFHQLQPNAFDPSPGHRPIPSPGLRCCGSWSKSHLLGTLTLSRWQGMTMVWQWCDNGVTMVTMKKTSETVTFQTYFVSLRMRLSKLEWALWTANMVVVPHQVTLGLDPSWGMDP